MGEYVPDGMAKDLYHIKRNLETLNENVEKESTMNNDIAGLLALMQNNKSMDLPGLLALCRDRGYDRNFSNNGEFMTIFLLLFLLGNGGWGGLGAANRAAFQECAGNSCQSIIGLHDRISAAQNASAQGFIQLDSKICESIANVITAVRNQGDRAVDATHDLQTQMQNCCCQIERGLDTVGCEVRGVKAAVELSQERTANLMQAMECRLSGQLKDTNAAMALGFERQTNLINQKFAEQEMDRLRRENCELKAQQTAASTANASVQALQSFMLAHWKPTIGSTTTPAA